MQRHSKSTLEMQGFRHRHLGSAWRNFGLTQCSVLKHNAVGLPFCKEKTVRKLQPDIIIERTKYLSAPSNLSQNLSCPDVKYKIESTWSCAPILKIQFPFHSFLLVKSCGA